MEIKFHNSSKNLKHQRTSDFKSADALDDKPFFQLGDKAAILIILSTFFLWSFLAVYSQQRDDEIFKQCTTERPADECAVMLKKERAVFPIAMIYRGK